MVAVPAQYTSPSPSLPAPSWAPRWRMPSSDFEFLPYGIWLGLTPAQRAVFNHAWDHQKGQSDDRTRGPCHGDSGPVGATRPGDTAGA